MRAAIFDVDGVLTDGRLYIGEQGETVKAFSTLDGHGLKLLARAASTPVVITGRDSAAVRRRVADLGLTHAHYGAPTSWRRPQALLAALGLAGPRWP
jgi:3-deoxy-D-manno-octulosonate 8-phosphate phosphatase (KDO 8-P phosphatase)